MKWNPLVKIGKYSIFKVSTFGIKRSVKPGRKKTTEVSAPEKKKKKLEDSPIPETGWETMKKR